MKAGKKIGKRLEARQKKFADELSKQGNSKLHFHAPGSRKK